MKKMHNNPAKKDPRDKRGNPKRKQISVTLAPDLYARLRSACEIQEHSDGQLGRILIEWSLPFYERARSVEALKYLAIKHFTALIDKPLEQQENDLSLVVAGGR